MAENTGTDLDNPDQTQTGASADKSQSEGGNANTGDEDVIPVKRFTAALKNQEEKLRAEFRAELAKMEAAKAAPPPKVPTRTELNKLVAEGAITQDAADEFWEKQITQKAAEEGAAKARELAAQEQRKSKIENGLRDYQALVGDAWVHGSDAHEKVKAKFNQFVENGLPPSPSTELAALEATFGSLDTLRASKSAKSGSSEQHVETGGSRPSRTESTSTDGPPRDLTPREKQYYERQIQNGAYKDWAAVREERKFAKSRARG